MQHNELDTLNRLIVRNNAAWEQSLAIRKQLWSLTDSGDEHQRIGIRRALALVDAELDRLADEGANLSTAWSLACDDVFGAARKGVLAVVK